MEENNKPLTIMDNSRINELFNSIMSKLDRAKKDKKNLNQKLIRLRQNLIEIKKIIEK